MWIVNFPALHPLWFWVAAIAWGVYQFMAGYHYGTYIFNSHRQNESHLVFVRRWFYGVHHGAFYFICTVSGFVAWTLARQMSGRITNWSEVATGTGAILVSLALLSVLGVSGILPR